MERIKPEDLEKFEARVKTGLRQNAVKRHLVVRLNRQRRKVTVRDGFTVEVLEGKDWSGSLSSQAQADSFVQERLQKHRRKPLSALIRK